MFTLTRKSNPRTLACEVVITIVDAPFQRYRTPKYMSDVFSRKENFVGDLKFVMSSKLFQEIDSFDVSMVLWHGLKEAVASISLAALITGQYQ